MDSNIINGLSINEAKYDLPNGTKGKIAVFLYTGASDPGKVIDYAISVYTDGKGYHELVAATLDNPWMRVIVSEINDMKQEPFDVTKHRLDR